MYLTGYSSTTAGVQQTWHSLLEQLVVRENMMFMLVSMCLVEVFMVAGDGILIR